MFKMFKEVLAAFVVIVLELCKGTKNLAEAFSATTEVVLEEAKLLVPDEVTKAKYREVARLEAQVELNKAITKAANTAKTHGVEVSDELQAQLDKLNK
jgi:hypothetical protein